MEIVVYDFTSRTNISIAPDGNAFHRVDGTPTHPNSFVDDYLSTVFATIMHRCDNPNILLNGWEKMLILPPPALLKRILDPFIAHTTLKPLKYTCLRYLMRHFKYSKKKNTVRVNISIIIFFTPYFRKLLPNDRNRIST